MESLERPIVKAKRRASKVLKMIAREIRELGDVVQLVGVSDDTTDGDARMEYSRLGSVDKLY